MARRAAGVVDGGNANVTSVSVTLPAGTAADDTIYLMVGTLATGAASVTGPGTQLADTGSISGALRAFLYEVTGHVAGEVLTVSWTTVSGRSGMAWAIYDNTTVRDSMGAQATTGTSATETLPGLSTSEPSEIAFGLAVAEKNTSAVTVTGVAGSTSVVSGTAGGGTRFLAFNVSEETVTSTGPTGDTTITLSATIGAFTGWIITHKANTGGGGGGGGGGAETFTGWGMPIN